MAYDVQELANSASNYQDLTLEKVLKKKRGRSCIKQEKRNRTLDTRIACDKLAASYAKRELSKEQKQFEKTVQEAAGRGVHNIPQPEALTTLRDNAKLAEVNLVSAVIAKSAMDTYPPLARSTGGFTGKSA